MVAVEAPNGIARIHRYYRFIINLAVSSLANLHITFTITARSLHSLETFSMKFESFENKYKFNFQI